MHEGRKLALELQSTWIHEEMKALDKEIANA